MEIKQKTALLKLVLVVWPVVLYLGWASWLAWWAVVLVGLLFSSLYLKSELVLSKRRKNEK